MTARNKTILFQFMALMALGLALLAILSLYIPLPLIALYFIALNLVTFVAFGQDKWAAQHKKERTAEMTFHLLGLFGAFPAIFFGRKIFRHKTQKQSYILTMWLFFAFQVMACGYLFIF